MAIRVLFARSYHRCRLPRWGIQLAISPFISHYHSHPSQSSISPSQIPFEIKAFCYSDQPIVTPFLCYTSSSLQIHATSRRAHSTDANTDDYTEDLDEINSKFAEAREEIELALESKETVYFDEDAEIARSATKEVLSRFEGLLARLPDVEKGRLQRSMGLKMEQLKAELVQLDD
ncbi:hypothetical protein O6H91_01G033800 [Diphasiastrum complanatum]|nr:hypothetical protein O6H91_01G033800 [Diphasiastrum complanatum]